MSNTIYRYISGHFYLADHHFESDDTKNNPKIKIQGFDTIVDTLERGDTKTVLEITHKDLYRRETFTEYKVKFHLHFDNKNAKQDENLDLEHTPYYFKHLNVHIHAHTPFCSHFDKDLKFETSTDNKDPLPSGNIYQEFTVIYQTKEPVEIVDLTVRAHFHLCLPLLLRLKSS